MQTDEQNENVELEQTNDVQQSEDTQVSQDFADPLDTIEDIDELRNKAKGFRSQANRYKKPKTQAPQNITRKEESQVKPLDILRDDAFKLYREGYTEDEIDLIIRNGGRKILEDKNNPLVLGLQVSKEQRRAEEAARMTSDSAGLSEVERKYTPEQLQNMSVEELKKILPHAN